VADALVPHAPHLFTTRQLEFRAAWTSDNARLAEAMAVPPDGIARVRQVHGRTVVTLAPGDVWADDTPADAIVSTDPSRAIAVHVADCVPILIADTAHRLVAAVHAGWRGTAAGVTGAALDAIEMAGGQAATLMAAVGPSIGPCCYQVDARVRDAFLSATPGSAEWFVEDGPDRWRLDLWRANVAILERRGVPRHAIHVSAVCTADHVDECFSYRREGAGTGRMVAAIRLRSSSG
jgi:YfiH family protein